MEYIWFKRIFIDWIYDRGILIEVMGEYMIIEYYIVVVIHEMRFIE